MLENCYFFNLKTTFENESPSPDGRENPFVPGFGTKDLEGQREIAPKKRHYFSKQNSIKTSIKNTFEQKNCDE